MKSALEMKPGGHGYVKRPMTTVVRALRAALFDLYKRDSRNQLGATEVEIHNYMSEIAGTFVVIEFEDGIGHLIRIEQVTYDDESGGDRRYRLTPEGHYAEEEARLTWPQRQWRELKNEFGTRLFWLLAGAAIVTAQRVLWP
jgi:hypothetical protein